MKIAVVHDYFTQRGGAEKVAEELFEMFPEADLFSTVAFPDLMPEKLQGVPVNTSWIQNLPGLRKYYRLFFLLYPLAVRALDLRKYDLVLTSSSSYAKAVRTGPDAVHICYCHTPTRWVWSYDSYSSREAFSGPVRAVLPFLLNILKRWDKGAARMPDHFIANSQVVADRIFKAYGRSAAVIPPPIDVDRFRVSLEQEDYYVVLARLVPYKRIDLAVEACTRLDRRLVVIGSGPDRAALEAIAGPRVKFTGRISDQEVEHYVSRCRALIFPGEEDFGMAALEVAAAGRPTIAFRAGGAVETILEGETGVFFDEQSPADVMSAIKRFEKIHWNPAAIRKHALTFSVEVFQERLAAFIEKAGASAANRRRRPASLLQWARSAAE